MLETGERIVLKMRKEDISFFSSLMSTYEGLGIVRTISPVEGIIEVLTTADMLTDLNGLIDSLAEEYGMQRMEASKYAYGIH